MTHASLFSGIGGFDLAAQWMGWHNAFSCEIDPFCNKILEHYWPDAQHYTDISKTDFTPWKGKVDILTGGFPCQPFSTAGKRGGAADARYLWPEMLRAIREVAPRYVVGENVPGLLSQSDGMVFAGVLTDLADAGYQTQVLNLPAAGIGAPHQRERLWFVAYSGCRDTQQRGHTPQVCGERYSAANGSDKACRPISHATYARCKPHNATQSDSTPHQSDRPTDGIGGQAGHAANPCGPDRCWRGKRHGWRSRGEEAIKGGWMEPWPHAATRLCSLANGVSGGLDAGTLPRGWRAKSLKGYGNAIVPGIAYQIFKALIETEKHL